MTLVLHSSFFGYGNLGFFDENVESDNHHTVTLLVVLDPELFDHNWSYTAVSRVFAPGHQSWTSAYKALLTINLTSPLRNPRGLTHSLARQLRAAFLRERSLYEQEMEELYQTEWEDQYPDPDDVCSCGHKASDHIMDTDACTKCDCQYFDQDPSEWETYTFTNVGGDKGGFIIVE